MAIKTLKLVGDFETTTDPNDLRVWASCLVNIENSKVEFLGNDIESFFDFLKDKNTTVYFANLKFDGNFIIPYLLKSGYRYSDKKESKTFNTLITDGGVFYCIEVIFERLNKKYKKVKFLDSLKKLPFKVSEIAKAFELEEEKLEIDYKAYRPKGHILTKEEEDYIIADCIIVAKALKIQFEKGLKKMTNASDAMSWYKKNIGLKQFDFLFPSFPIALDNDIRRAYKGGFTHLQPDKKEKRIYKGLRFDINSLYPFVMYTELLPYGYPIFFEGEYEYDKYFPLYICRIRCSFELKKDHIPTIQLKNNYRFVPTEYLTSSKDEIIEMTVTNVDLELIKDHYTLGNYECICGWKFKGMKNMFKHYIDYWMKIKETSEGSIKTLAKLQLNSLYGRFATRTDSKTKIPELEDNIVKYRLLDITKESGKQLIKKYDLEEPEQREPVYTALSCFVTAYARNKTIRTAQTLYPRYIYSDTDSIHIEGFEIPDNIEIHPTKLGAWKLENHFCDSYFIKPKCYLETDMYIKPTLYNYCKLLNNTFKIKKNQFGIRKDKLKVTCAGMPDNVKEKVTYENFKRGTTFEGKLKPVIYENGVVLEDTTFTIY